MDLPKNLRQMFETTMFMCSLGANVDIGSISTIFTNTKEEIKAAGVKDAELLIANLNIGEELAYINACNNPRNVYPKKTF